MEFYSTVFGVDRTRVSELRVAAFFAVQAVVLVAYALVRAARVARLRDQGRPAPRSDAPRKRAGVAALITPVLPLVLLRGFGVDAIVGFALAAVYGVLVDARRAAIVQTLVAAWIRGIEDVAPGDDPDDRHRHAARRRATCPRCRPR